MALTSSSTMTDALAQYNDNLVWEGDATKARLALEAIRWLQVNRPMVSEKGDVKIDWASLAASEREISSYVSRTNTTRRTNFVRAVPRTI